MKIRKTGQIAEYLYVLGDSGVPSFLLTGHSPILIDAGFSCMGPAYVKEASNLFLETGPRSLFLTHSHFDHCGATTYLKQYFPDLLVGCSPIAKKVFDRPNAIDTIKVLNQAAQNMLAQELQTQIPQVEFEPFDVDIFLKDKDVFRVAEDMTLEVIETPGHTKDCLSFYVPEKKLLFSSEAAGILDDTGYIFCDFLVDYEMYHQSLEKLAKLEVETICLGHGYVLTGADAHGYMANALSQCSEFCETVGKQLVAKNGDEKKVAEAIKKTEYDDKPFPKQPEPAYLLNLAARISVVKNRMPEFA